MHLARIITCVEDEAAACGQRLQEQWPGMAQCILAFNRRGRIPSATVQESMRLFAQQVMPTLQRVPAAE
jgi:hypothetical protein